MKNIVKGIIAVVAMLIIVLGICFINKDEKENRENTLVVGLDDSFPPMGFRNENNEIVGFDIDLAKEECRKYLEVLESYTPDFTYEVTNY